MNTWDLIAKQYIERVDSAPYNALYERPAMVSMMPELRGCRVLDLGCGSGFFLELALARGAKSVTGVDRSEEMIRHCMSRTQGRAALFQADLRSPMLFLGDHKMDIAIASLVVHYLPDIHAFGREVWRVVAPGGSVIISTSHPMADFYDSASTDYFAVEEVEDEWSSYGITMSSYRRPLSDVIGSFTECGFLIDAVLEPRPLEQMAHTHPTTYQSLRRKPGFICLRYRKPLSEIRMAV